MLYTYVKKTLSSIFDKSNVSDFETDLFYSNIVQSMIVIDSLTHNPALYIKRLFNKNFLNSDNLHIQCNALVSGERTLSINDISTGRIIDLEYTYDDDWSIEFINSSNLELIKFLKTLDKR